MLKMKSLKMTTRRKSHLLTPILAKICNLMLPAKMVIQLRNRFGGARDLEIDLLSDYVSANSKVIDVGAHIGSYTYVLAKLVGPNGKVYSFEPQPNSFQYLVDGFKAHKNVILHNLIVSNQNSMMKLSIPTIDFHPKYGNAGGTLNSLSEDHQTVLVKAIKLDDCNLGRISFIKIDTEGNELRVLQGAREIIQRNLPVIMIEILAGTSEENSSGIWSILRGNFNYNCFHLENGALIQTENFKYLGEIAARLGDRSFNYIFIPELLKAV